MPRSFPTSSGAALSLAPIQWSALISMTISCFHDPCTFCSSDWDVYQSLSIWLAPYHLWDLSLKVISSRKPSLNTQSRVNNSLSYIILHFLSSLCMSLTKLCSMNFRATTILFPLCTQHPEEFLTFSKNSVQNCKKNILALILPVFSFLGMVCLYGYIWFLIFIFTNMSIFHFLVYF